MEYQVDLIWDKEACVWVATSKDVEGLVLESESLDVLVERVRATIPELLQLNHRQKDRKANICFKSERYEEVIF